MFVSLKKTIAGSLAALTVGLALAGAAAPASAQPLYHGGMHGGMHGGWHGGHGFGGRGWGPVAALGVAGLVAGAIVASQGPYYNDCTGYRPVYDGYGNYVGQRPVNVCQ
jgi:hypothetical protein